MANEPVKQPALFTLGDLSLAVSEIGHTGLAQVLSTDRCNHVIAGLARLATWLRPGKQARTAARYAAILGTQAKDMPQPANYAPQLIENFLHQRQLIARLSADPAHRPKSVLEGAEIVDAALSAGRGVVFWCAPLLRCVTPFRLAAFDRGWSLNHISLSSHGPARSRIGRAIFNRRECRIEERYSTRLVLQRNDMRDALTSARRVLQNGGFVSFRGLGRARRPLRLPLFEGEMTLATGALSMARRTDAALVMVCPRLSSGVLHLGLTLLDTDKERSDGDIAQDFAVRLEDAIRCSPTLWNVLSDQWSPASPPPT